MPYCWICDTCGMPILKHEDGWVEWTKAHMAGNQWVVKQMRLVHHLAASPRAPGGTCEFNDVVELQKNNVSVCSRPMKDYLGHDGLMRLLEYAVDPEFKNIDIAEMIKRFQIPGYDQAKQYFDRAIQKGVIELDCPKGFYTQQQIKAVIDHYEL